MAPLPALAGFSLAGGTSLALRFGHRLSVDLDFFTSQEFDPSRLPGVLPDAHHRILGLVRSLSFFEDAESEPNPVPLAGQNWPDVKARVIRAVRQYPARGME